LYISLHLSVRPSVCPSVTRQYYADTAQHIRNFYCEMRMHSTDYVIARCSSVWEANSIETFICPMFTTIVCLCFCIHMSVYHVHSYVSVCLSATFMYTIRPFRTFLRLSVDLRVFCVCLFSCKYITCTVVCLAVCYIRAPSSQHCLCV